MDSSGRNDSGVSRFTLGLTAVLLLGGLLPLIASVVCHLYAAEWCWAYVPLHSVVEALGTFSALALGVLILLLRRDKRISGYHLWILCELVGQDEREAK